MSHVSSVSLFVSDLDALEAVLGRMGGELMREQKTHAWWGSFAGDSNDYGQHDPKTFGQCEHAIKIKGTTPHMGAGGPWEIGLVKRLDGQPGYELIYDAFGHAGQALEKTFGRKLVGLKQELATEVATRHLVRQGYRVSVGVNAQGQRQVVGTKA